MIDWEEEGGEEDKGRGERRKNGQDEEKSISIVYNII